MVLDERYVEQALQEYREATADYSIFPDLQSELQSTILRRAQQLKDTDQEKGAAANPVAIRFRKAVMAEVPRHASAPENML